MRDNRTFFILLFFSLILFIGWQQFLSWKFPQPKAAEKVKVSPGQYRDAVRATAGALLPDTPVLGNTAQLVLSLQAANLPEREKQIATHLEAIRKKRQEQVVKQTTPREEIQLGDDTTNLKVVLTSQGAGVQSVTLMGYEQADRYGQPTNENLRLIPGEDEKGLKLPPSFQLFHFEEGPDDRPWDTLGKLDWRMPKDKTKQGTNNQGKPYTSEVTFEAEVPDQGIVVTKTYSLQPSTYHLGLTVGVRLKDSSSNPKRFRYQLSGGHGLPIEGQWYTGTYRTAMIGLTNNLNRPWRDYQDARTINIEQGGKRVNRETDRLIRYAAVAVQYFTSAIVVDNEQTKQDFLEWARPTLPWPGYVSRTDLPQLDDLTVRVNTVQFEVGKEEVNHKYLLYHGPVKVALLEHLTEKARIIDPALAARYQDDLRLDTLTDYKFPSTPEFFTSIGWTYLLIKCTNLMHAILGILYTYLYLPYGIAIIALTVLVRLAMFPISRKQALMSVRMQALAPEMKELQAKYADDPRAKQQAVMELYRKHGVNPFGSCWVMLLQMPIFMGLYYALQESIHFRLANFLWIDNLAAPDMLFGWGELIPWINRPDNLGGMLYLGPYFNLLPIIAIALMVVQQKMFTPPPADEQQEMQMKMMKYMMVFMGILFYKVAAGLALYFIVSSAWGLAERRFLPKAGIASGKPEANTSSAKAPAAQVKGKQRAEKDKGKTKKDPNGMLTRVQGWWEEILKEAKKK